MKRKAQLLLPLILGLALPACSFASGKVDSSEPVDHSSSNNNSGRAYPVVKQAPRLESFSEVAYYAPYMNEEIDHRINAKQMLLGDEVLSSEAAASSLKESMATSMEEESAPSTSIEGQDYRDEQGRYHYPIEIKPTYTFSNFIYFDFTSEGCDFLEANIGNGLIHGLIVQTEIFSELMIVLRNEDKFFSCFLNGGGPSGQSFSAHKFVEGFDLVKDLDLKYAIDVAYGKDETSYDRYIPISIGFGGQTPFAIDPESILESEPVTVSINELRAHFGLEPDPRFE